MAKGPFRMVRREAAAYAGDEERPLGSFLGVMAVYGSMVAGLSAAVKVSGRPLPRRIGWSDLVLATVATHKLARLISKDPVTSPLRAPFTRFAGTSGEAELSEEVRGSGVRKAVGELISCPFCLDQWVATWLVFGVLLAPRTTRVVVALFAAVAGADFLHFAYAKLQG